MQLLSVVLPLVVLIGAAWFWVHCARPMLRYRSAGPMTTRLLFAVTVYTVVAVATFIAATAASRASHLLWVIATLPWLLIVGLPYLDEYRSFIRYSRDVRRSNE